MLEIILKNSKTKLGNYCILCTDQKNLQKYLQKFGQHYLIMETIFMNSENSKTNEPYRFKLDLIDKLNLKDPKKICL